MMANEPTTKTEHGGDTGSYVQIIDPSHPHYPETGRWAGNVVSLFGKPLAEITLDGCKHGTDGCFVAQGQIRQISDPAAHPARRSRAREHGKRRRSLMR